jgi:lysophospholipase L1-like esterase
MSSFFLRAAPLAALFAIVPAPLVACPLIDGLIDFNCNQTHKVVITGDSVVAGIGDTENKDRGGYPKRLSALLPNSSVLNVGVSGLTTGQVLRNYRTGDFLSRSKNADILIIDAGRNDCRDNLPTSVSVKNIKRLVKLVRKKIGLTLHSPPFVVVATQIPNRDDRRSCVEALNRELLRQRSKRFPVYLRFDRMSASVLSSDGLHPDSAGYSRMAKKAAKFIQKRVQALSAKQRLDADSDNVYDHFETERYLTDPTQPDTDSDGLVDGDELFIHGTEPLIADTDGGGINDGNEVSNGTDPLDAADDQQ